MFDLEKLQQDACANSRNISNCNGTTTPPYLQLMNHMVRFLKRPFKSINFMFTFLLLGTKCLLVVIVTINFAPSATSYFQKPITLSYASEYDEFKNVLSPSRVNLQNISFLCHNMEDEELLHKALKSM